MRRSLASAIVVAFVADCAPASQPVLVLPRREEPSSLEVADFGDIPLSRCTPALVGLFVSHGAADDLARGIRRDEKACALAGIEATKRADIAEAKQRAAEDELHALDPMRTWALIGKLSVAGIVVGAIVAGIAVIYQAVRP